MEILDRIPFELDRPDLLRRVHVEAGSDDAGQLMDLADAVVPLAAPKALGAARRHLDEHLVTRFALGKTSTMSPGSADAAVWPIQQQRQLFGLFGDVEGLIGVRLTDSCLMVPNKTVSGVRFPTQIDFRSCQVCHREDCPSRSAPFDAERLASYEHGPSHDS